MPVEGKMDKMRAILDQYMSGDVDNAELQDLGELESEFNEQ